jgi:hypothetical protein
MSVCRTVFDVTAGAWSYTSTPPYVFLAWYLRIAYFVMAWYLLKHRENFTFPSSSILSNVVNMVSDIKGRT